MTWCRRRRGPRCPGPGPAACAADGNGVEPVGADESVIRRARHNFYRVKRPGDTGIRYHGPPSIRLANLPATVRINLV